MVFNDLYDGQAIDARRYSDTWLEPGFSDESWVGVHRAELDFATLTPYIGPPVSRQEELRVVTIWTSPAGKTLVDFGQNLVGWVRVHVQGPTGTTITLRHAEVLENDELGMRPLRTAKATDRFILSGGDDVFEPTFTFHGFRYVEVDGWPGAQFGCANCRGGPLRVAAHRRVRVLQRVAQPAAPKRRLGNTRQLLDLPTDCPQRDERLGWTGDIAVFAPRPPTCSMWTISFETGWRIWLPSSRQQTVACPWSCQTS